MKKIFVITGVITLFFILAKPGYTGYGVFNTDFGSHFMRVEARDAENRLVKSEVNFSNSAFFETYSSLVPFRAARWHRSSESTSRITQDRRFQIPLAAVSFIFNNGQRFLQRFSERFFCKGAFHKTNYLLLILFSVLLFEPHLQSKKEPRFRVPILIE